MERQNIYWGIKVLKIQHYILIFIVSLLLFTILLFPINDLIKNLCCSFENKTGLILTYESSGPLIIGVRFNNLKIKSKEKEIISLNKMGLTAGSGGIALAASEGSGKISARLKRNKITYKITDFQIPESFSGLLGEGIINNLTGSYEKKEKKGTGDFLITLTDMPRLSIKEALSIDGKYAVEKENISSTFNLNGKKLKGNGSINIILDRNFENSVISGMITAGLLQLNLSGTIGNAIIKTM